MVSAERDLSEIDCEICLLPAISRRSEVTNSGPFAALSLALCTHTLNLTYLAESSLLKPGATHESRSEHIRSSSRLSAYEHTGVACSPDVVYRHPLDAPARAESHQLNGIAVLHEVVACLVVFQDVLGLHQRI